MSQGSDFLVQVSDDPSGATQTIEVELQGDLTINPGRSTNTTVYKNGQSSSTNDAGFTATFTMGNTAPQAAGEALVWDLHESKALGYVEIINKVTGGIQWAFPARIAIASVGAGVNNPTDVQVQIAADGEYPNTSPAA